MVLQPPMAPMKYMHGELVQERQLNASSRPTASQDPTVPAMSSLASLPCQSIPARPPTTSPPAHQRRNDTTPMDVNRLCWRGPSPPGCLLWTLQ